MARITQSGPETSALDAVLGTNFNNAFEILCWSCSSVTPFAPCSGFNNHNYTLCDNSRSYDESICV